MAPISEDLRQPSLTATIEQVRYWAPTIGDVAHISEHGEDGEGWILSIVPHAIAACPVSLALREDGRFDIVLAGETYPAFAFDSPDRIVPFLECIVAGQVLQRHWISTATGIPQGIETLVRLGAGLRFHNGAEPVDGIEYRDRHFLPYRRRP